MLQPFHYDPNEKNRHKFLVQTLIVPDGVAEVQESLVQMFISITLYHLILPPDLPYMAVVNNISSLIQIPVLATSGKYVIC